jgi:hypothetical protein
MFSDPFALEIWVTAKFDFLTTNTGKHAHQANYRTSPNASANPERNKQTQASYYDPTLPHCPEALRPT